MKKQKHLSFFETWPTWFIYLPVAIAVLFKAIKYRSLTVCLIANPKIQLSGLTSISKADFLDTANNSESKNAILEFVKIWHNEDNIDTKNQSLALIKEKGLTLPLAAKPDRGYRGAGVNKVDNEQQLLNYIAKLPKNCFFLLQKLASYKPEAGVFYIRYPNQANGNIVSIGIKHNPEVIGDGVSNLEQLIDADPRRLAIRDKYISKHKQNLTKVLAKDQKLELLFSASHAEGSIFTNGNAHITATLTKKIDEIMKGFDQLYYGRLDIKYKDIAALEAGKNLEIIEINGASSEPLHIWDKDTGYFTAMRALIKQYNTLYDIGNMNKQKGYEPPSLLALYKALKLDRNLIKNYPPTQ